MLELEKILNDGISLQEVADVMSGQILTRVNSKNGEGEIVRVLAPKAIVSGVIVEEDLRETILEKSVDSKKYTREGDVVIKLSSPYDAAYITSEEARLLIPSFCAVVRVRRNDKLDAKYLSAFLNSSYVTNYMRMLDTGAGAPMISTGVLRNLKIPRVSIRDMKDIGEAYILSGRKKAILNEMISAEERLMENIVLENIKEVVSNG